LRKSQNSNHNDQQGQKDFNWSLSSGHWVLNAEERSVARLILFFPDIVAEATRNYAPSTLCVQLFQLAQAFNLFYQKHSILGGDTRNVTRDTQNQKEISDISHTTSHVSQFRLTLTAATAQVLKNGLYLLGIATLEQM
jgi:arginyl-tRNA synthetase